MNFTNKDLKKITDYTDDTFEVVVNAALLAHTRNCLELKLRGSIESSYDTQTISALINSIKCTKIIFDCTEIQNEGMVITETDLIEYVKAVQNRQMLSPNFRKTSEHIGIAGGFKDLINDIAEEETRRIAIIKLPNWIKESLPLFYKIDAEYRLPVKGKYIFVENRNQAIEYLFPPKQKEVRKNI